MGFRFRRSVRLLPGVRLNFSKSGISTSLGGPGASLNLGGRGKRITVGIPGTGLSWSTLQRSGVRPTPMTTTEELPSAQQRTSVNGWGWIAAAFMAVVTIAAIASHGTPSNTTASPAVNAATTPAIVSVAHANCRADPSPAAAIVTAFSHGDPINVTGHASGWSRLDRPEGACWMADRLLSTVSPSIAPAAG